MKCLKPQNPPDGTDNITRHLLSPPEPAISLLCSDSRPQYLLAAPGFALDGSAPKLGNILRSGGLQSPSSRNHAAASIIYFFKNLFYLEKN